MLVNKLKSPSNLLSCAHVLSYPAHIHCPLLSCAPGKQKKFYTKLQKAKNLTHSHTFHKHHHAHHTIKEESKRGERSIEKREREKQGLKQESNGECSSDMEQRRREIIRERNCYTLCRRRDNRGTMEQNGVNGSNKNIRTSKETLPNPFRRREGNRERTSPITSLSQNRRRSCRSFSSEQRLSFLRWKRITGEETKPRSLRDKWRRKK